MRQFLKGFNEYVDLNERLEDRWIPLYSKVMRHPDAKESQELQLIHNAQKGDERAFLRLVRKYEDMVYRFAFQVCRDEDKAAETLQDTFVNVYKKLGQFDGRSQFTTWIYRIVANNCLMKRRKRKMDVASISLDTPEGFRNTPLKDEHGNVIQTIPSWRETPLDSMMNAELKETLNRAIKRLPVDHRVVFALRDIEGKSAEETAKILKLSVPAVKSRLRRARMFLREQLHGYMKA